LFNAPLLIHALTSLSCVALKGVPLSGIWDPPQVGEADASLLYKSLLFALPARMIVGKEPHPELTPTVLA